MCERDVDVHRKKTVRTATSRDLKWVKGVPEKAPELIPVTFLVQIVIVHKEIWMVLQAGFSNLKPRSNGPQGGFSGP